MLNHPRSGPGQEIPFSFTGTGWDYFKVFLVNTLLTIITLGIYGAWARVRTRRFFLGNTFLGEHNFDFDAQPVSILFARVVVVGVLLALNFAETALELVWHGVGLAAVGVVLLLPFALVRGRAFVARHSLHRGVRFGYATAYLRTVLLVGGWAALAAGAAFVALEIDDGDYRYAPLLLLAVLLAPLLLWLGHRVQLSQLRFGALPLRHAGGVFEYYGELLKAGGYVAFFLLVMFAEGLFEGTFGTPVLLAFGLVALGLLLHGAGVLRPLFTRDVTVLQATAFILIVFIFIPLVDAFIEQRDPDAIVLSHAITVVAIGAHCLALIQAALSCAYWRSVRLGPDSRIESKIEWFRYAQLLTANYVLAVVTLGLLYPWARVRAAEHVAARLRLVLGPETAAAYAAAGAGPGPLGGELADVVGWDIDFGAV